MAISDASDCSPRESGVSQPFAAVQLSDLDVLAEAADRISNDTVDEIGSEDSSFNSGSSSESSSDFDSPTVVATPNRLQALGEDEFSREFNDFSKNSADSAGIELSSGMEQGMNRLHQKLNELDNEYQGDDGAPPSSPDYLGGQYTADHWDRCNNYEEENRTVIMKTTYNSASYQGYPVLKNKEGELNQVIRCLRSVNERYELLGPAEGFTDFYEAIEVARIERQKLSAFDGYTEDDGPPWHGCNDHHQVIIDVVDWDQYQEFIKDQQSSHEYLSEKWRNYQVVLDMEVGRIRMSSTQTQVFYSYPTRKMWNQKADMEIWESNNSEMDLLKKIRPDAGGMRSMMYRGHTWGSLGAFLRDTDREKPFRPEQVGLLRHLESIDNLEELFLEISLETWQNHIEPGCPVSEMFISELAPKMRNLKVLSFGPGLSIYPEALMTIKNSFPALERLDVSFALSFEYAVTKGEKIRDDEKHLFYQHTIPACVIALKSLVRLDIGDRACQTDKSDKYILSRETVKCIEEMLEHRGGHLTQSSETLPPFWPKTIGPEKQQQMHSFAMQKIIHNGRTDPDLRNLAYLDMQTSIANRDREAEARNKPVVIDENIERAAPDNQPAVIEENLDESPASAQEATVASNSSNKRRHNEEELSPDSSKITRLS